MRCYECERPYLTGQSWVFEMYEDGTVTIWCPDCSDIYLVPEDVTVGSESPPG